MINFLRTLKKYIKNYGHLPRISVNTYSKLPSILSILIRYLEKRYLKNKSLLKFYPLRDIGTYFQNPMYQNKDNKAYFLQFYKQKSNVIGDIFSEENTFTKGEIFFGKKINKNNKVALNIQNDLILPLSVLNPKLKKSPSIISENSKIHGKVKFEYDDNSNNQINLFLDQNRFNYIKLNKGNKIKISSNNDLIIGDSIDINQTKKTKFKLVLLVFVDNLASQIVRSENLKNLMPNTFSFFSKGKIFDNHYINGHWTLDSVPTFFTGKYPSNHRVFDPLLDQDITKGNMTITKYFKEYGYLNFFIGGNQRTAPNYGYVKDFDRTIFSRHQPAEEIITETIDQLKSFNKRSQFGFLTLMDLHNSLDYSPHLETQVKLNLDDRVYSKRKSKTLEGTFLTKLDKKYNRLYIHDLERMDFYLKNLYDFINQNYNNEEFLVSLVSDHGFHTLKDENVLSNNKTKVPFMIRGGNLNPEIINDFTENSDVFNIILNQSQIKIDENLIDGKLPISMGGHGRNFAFSEAIYPGQTYKAKIVDEKFIFYFNTTNKVNKFGKINDIEKYNFKLINKNNNEMVSANSEINKNYLEHILSNARKRLRF